MLLFPDSPNAYLGNQHRVGCLQWPKFWGVELCGAVHRSLRIDMGVELRHLM